MNLHSLKIEGFRKHCDTTINFSDSTFLIGENNVGKSSILAALNLLLSPIQKIPEEEFYSITNTEGKTIRSADQVVLTAEFRNLPIEAKEWRGFKGRLIPYEPSVDNDTGLSFVYRKTYLLNAPSPRIHVLQYSQSLKPGFGACKTITEFIINGLDTEEIPDKLREIPPEQTLKKAEKDLLLQIESLYDFSETDSDWFENPGGIPQNVISKLPNFLLIPAQDREEEISGGSGTLHKTLEELFKEVRDGSDNYRQAQYFLSLLEAELDPTQPETKVAEMMRELNDVVADVFPTACILATTNLSNPDATIKPAFSIQMSSNITTRASLQGTGMIRSAVFALLRYKSLRDAKRKDEEARTLIIGFEEPELYLHPNAINKIRDTIYRLAEYPNNQIVCTTHSPYMIDISRKPRQILNSLSLQREGTEGNQSECISVIPFSVSTEFQNLQDDDKQYVKMLLRVDEVISRSFFVKKVLIVEGDSEQIILNESISLLPEEIASVIRSDWHIIRARGKAAIIPVVKYLKAMGIEVYVIHDGDYGTDGAEVFNEPISQALSDNNKLVVLNKCLENALGYEPTTKDKPLKAYKYAVENWHTYSDISSQWRSALEKIFNESNPFS